MRLRLMVKLAEMVEGIDLSHCAEGDVIELPDHHARILIRGGWAERTSNEERVTCAPAWRSGVAAERAS